MLIFLCFIIYITDVLAIWVLIPRDNSTIVDAANFLGCVRSTNVIGNNTKIYIDDYQKLVLEIEHYDEDYRSQNIVMKCFSMFGHSISFTIMMSVEKGGRPMPVYIGTLSEVTDKWFAIIPRIPRREKFEHPFGDQKEKEQKKERFNGSNCCNRRCPLVPSGLSYEPFDPRIEQCSIFQEIMRNSKGKCYY